VHAPEAGCFRRFDEGDLAPHAVHAGVYHGSLGPDRVFVEYLAGFKIIKAVNDEINRADDCLSIRISYFLSDRLNFYFGIGNMGTSYKFLGDRGASTR
jgi:hypothetical protein